MKKLSVVVPCYNEEAVVAETYSRLSAVLEAMPVSAEILFVDDGSRDQTARLLKELACRDARVKLIRFSRNFGHQAAVAAGLRYCTGTEAAIIDADLQDPPEAIPPMRELMEREACDVVYGQRTRRPGEGILKRLSAHVFYKILNSLSDVKFPVDTGDFRLMDRRVIDVFNALPERNKYIRGLIGWLGFKQVPYRYAREPRFAGETKYTVARMMKLATDGVLSFSRAPLRIAMRIGMLSVVVAIGVALWAITMKLIGAQDTASGWASTVAIIVFLGGVQLLSIGVLGEYIGSIFDESKRRPEYVVEELVNVSEERQG